MPSPRAPFRQPGDGPRDGPRDAAATAGRRRHLVWLFPAGLGLLFLLTAPRAWNLTPDSGMYLGSAWTLLNEGRYWFNCQPNLHYFPGYPLVLLPWLAAFGLDWLALGLHPALLFAASLALSFACFSPRRYGASAYVLIFLLSCSSLFALHARLLLSDMTFVCLVLAVCLLWRGYVERKSAACLWAALALAAFAPLVRFQGVFVIAALGVALLVQQHRAGALTVSRFFQLVLLGVLVSLPFVAWSARNYLLHSPDTFSMLNSRIFGLETLALYSGEGAGRDLWPDAPWKYLYHRLLNLAVVIPRSLLPEAWESVVPREAYLLVFGALCLCGLRFWWRRTTLVEAIFAALLIGHLVAEQLHFGKHLYVVARYWMPVFPTVLAICLGGCVTIWHWVRPGWGRSLVSGAFAFLLASIAIQGALGLAERVRDDAGFARTMAEIRAATDYVNRETPADAVIATTDWGIVPFHLQRCSYQVLDDPSHLRSIERMLNYRTTYLVVVDGLARFPPFARRMVRDIPAAFLPLEVAPGRRLEHVDVYRVDLSALSAYAAAKAKGG